MGLRGVRFTIVAFGVLTVVPLSCGGDDRTFVDGTGGTAGAGASGGGAGSSGTAGDASAGAAGSGGKPCTSAAQCDDGETCNGSETCDAGYCKSGTPTANGTTCTPNFGDAGSADAGSAEYVCANGLCALKCETDAECEDNDVCTGAEICNPSTKTCQSGTPPACDDSDDCTDNQCDPETGCFYPVIDGDGDGHAADTLGSCGDDCNDADPAIYGGAAELCDNKDNNCNGSKDELAPDWYVDCDGDGYAASGAAKVAQCDKPTTPHASCSGTGGWTDKAPAAGTTDCWDKDAKAHPMTATENDKAWQSVAISGAPTTIDYDYNCDGTEERRWSTGSVSTTAKCSYTCTGSLCYCGGAAGWSSAVPACGGTGTYSSCNILSCTRLISTGKKQECR